MNKLLEGKYALITGGGRGIGKAVALEFAKNGANVAISSRTKSELDKTVEEIREYGVKGLPIPADLSTIDGVNECVASYFNNFNVCNILVPNAGMSHYSSIIDMPLEDALKLFNLNYIGYFALIKQILPNILEQGGGKIILTSSAAGTLAFPAKKVAYASSKAAVAVMGRCLDSEVGSQNVHVNVVCPGPVETKMLEDNRRWGAKYPISHGPEVMAPIYLFLASDLSKRPYKGRLIDHYSFFELLAKLQKETAEINVEDINIKDLLKSTKERFNKDTHTLFRKNQELVDFMLKYKV